MKKIKQAKQKYATYDPELKRLVSATGDPRIAIELGVPRGTAYYWAKNLKLKESSPDIDKVFSEKLNSLRDQLEVEKAKVKFVSSLSKYLEVISNKKRRVSKNIKKTIVSRVDDYLKYCPLKELLGLISLNESRYYKWRSEINTCLNTKSSLCGVRHFNQLTTNELFGISSIVKDKKFSHFSLTSLWKYSVKNNLVVCSLDTWFKYINKYDLNRKKMKKYKPIHAGVRANYPNEIWHIDISIIRLPNGEKLYFQAIIDNFSRYIIEWNLSSTKEAINTFDLIKKALKNLNKSPLIYMDSGTENKNEVVSSLFIGKSIKRVLAQVDVRESNSMIEAFFRSMKNNYLYETEFKSHEELIEKLTFYINEYNNRVPHSAFDFETPADVYFDKWGTIEKEKIQKIKADSLLRRRSENEGYNKCSRCLVA